MGVVRSFLLERLFEEFPAREERLAYSQALSKMLDLDLNLMCDSYFHATMDRLQALNQELEFAGAQLMEANAIKDEFLAQVSHDLRTPLNSILSFTKLVLDGLCTDPEEEKEVLRDVFSSGQLLLRLVNDLLDISVIEAGKLALTLEPIDPRAILDSTLPLVAMQAAAKVRQLVDETLEQKPPTVRGDEIRFRQVLINLLSNAVKFTPRGQVTVRGIENKPEGFLRFEIEDTGMGIPEEKRNAVFEKFVRHDVQALRGISGSGLGLAIAKRLVEMMNGRSDWKAEWKGKARSRGSRCRWPRWTLEHGRQGRKKRRIIVVEDNALVAKFFRMALERAGGFSWMVTEDVPKIVEEVKEGKVDLVLLDLSLSNAEWEGHLVNGVELCQILKAQSAKHLPVLLATAHAMAGDRERFLEASGADGYLEKPVYDAAQLVAKVRELMD